MIVYINRTFCFLILLVCVSVSNAQTCTHCQSRVHDTLVYRISSTDTATYVLSAGRTLCIYDSGMFKGRVVINGGTICNSGEFFPKSILFNSGSIINNKTAKIWMNLTLGSGSVFINNSGSTLDIGINLTISGGTLNNEGLINAGGRIHNNSGLVHNKSIINCASLTGINTIMNYTTGIVNIQN